MLLIGVAFIFSSVLGVSKALNVPRFVHHHLDWAVMLGMILILGGGAVLRFNAYQVKHAERKLRVKEHAKSRVLFFE